MPGIDLHGMFGMATIAAAATQVLLHMIQVLITQALDDGVLQVTPPILCRVYRTLSRGLVNLVNATKIKNTRFPYPCAQIINIFLMLHMIWTPSMISFTIKVPRLAVIVSFSRCLACSP
mmetsp:Transcript_95216/g.308324  ORF Transcript_95216/g.308324 Transcript_95216/m.308324 type:complete len:119 (+) Transcript_95216:100-456(+)